MRSETMRSPSERSGQERVQLADLRLAGRVPVVGQRIDLGLDEGLHVQRGDGGRAVDDAALQQVTDPDADEQPADEQDDQVREQEPARR